MARADPVCAVLARAWFGTPDNASGVKMIDACVCLIIMLNFHIFGPI